MGTLETTRDVIARTERLVDLLELRRDWNRGAFDGCVYEHMLPIFDSAYLHFVKPLRRPGEQAERQRLQRAINEVFGTGSRGFNLAPPHSAMMGMVANYVFLERRLRYPITEWTQEELFLEYDNSFLWSSVWGVIGLTVAMADVSALVAGVVAKIMAAATVVRAAGTIGVVATVAGVSAALLTYAHYTRQRDRIREEIQDRIDRGEIPAYEWDMHDLATRRRYNA